MAIQGFGNLYSSNIVADSARLRRKPNGLQEGECTFECLGAPLHAGNVLRTKHPIGSMHPYSSSVWMESQEVVFMANGARLVCTYAGADFQFLDKPVYELIISMEEVPIETHPSFEQIAGTPSDPDNGALFRDPETGSLSTDNSTAVFDRFLPFVAGNVNPKAGVEAYLDPVATYRESYVSYYLPTVGSLGAVTNSVPGPGYPGGSRGKRNWLYTGYTYRRRGDPAASGNRILYEVAREWRLSGRNGWDPDIYS